MRKEQCERLQKEFVPSQFQEIGIEKVPVNIEYEQEFEITCSEDDDNDLDSKSKRSGNTMANRQYSEFTRSQKALQSPENFRQKAKLRMNTLRKVRETNESSMKVNANSEKVNSSAKKMIIVHTNDEA